MGITLRAQIAVIINASSGAGYSGEWELALVEKFHAHDMDAQVTLAKTGAELLGAAQRALAARPDAIVAGGGDGTINAVASVVVGTGIPFGVLPMGTLNHFAKDANIPLQLDDAIRNIAIGDSIAVDVGEVNSRIFLNNSSLGIYPDIVREREKQQKRLGRGKWTAFGWSLMTALRRYPFLHVRLSVNGAYHHREAPFIFIGNNEYSMEGFTIGERSSLVDGHLSLYVAQRTGRLGLLRLALHALFGRLRQARDFDVLTARDILIEGRRRRMRVALDGEVTVMEMPLQYRIRAGALQVIVPKNGRPTTI
ncbi:MAG: diacylglycerol kinase family protein [Pseudomonadota bacterium]